MKNKLIKHLVLFFTTAGIGNLICLGLYIYKKNKKAQQKSGKDINVGTNENPFEFYYRMKVENLNLAKYYEKQYDFEKALLHCRLADNSISKLIELQKQEGLDMDYLTPPRVYESQLLVKMNRLDEAINVLLPNRELEHYKYDKIFRESIENTIADIQKKKERGYIYKPRKK